MSIWLAPAKDCEGIFLCAIKNKIKKKKERREVKRLLPTLKQKCGCETRRGKFDLEDKFSQNESNYITNWCVIKLVGNDSGMQA